MRSLIFIFLISLSLISSANEFCGVYENINLIKANDNLILKCDCNCTNEENRFYIDGVNSKNVIEASRLLSLNGVSFADFDLIKRKNNVCYWQNYNSSYEKGVIFAIKVPDGDQICFEIKNI
ncbi:hypothetical protein BKK49_12505 [Rodentibacter rarus]|uniref:Uncharacterized protein n=1 Tax=Rodentibacter rarus TaxID=1908260 RepID=A0A1V3IDL5_9PAST|nr:hypothetical protein [Rodentibacter rarus]OOF35531.1 hypothetical protein BKK49_12505 [Rodentibacter rarus]OOF38615.1 hypothetical protein BKK50_11495 [Rodentibacter rarus]